MAPSLRLTLRCALAAAVLGMAVIPAAAGSPNTPADASPPLPATEENKAERPAPSPQQAPAPNGCPYRDGTLELIV
jgi:hypothetical protein